MIDPKKLKEALHTALESAWEEVAEHYKAETYARLDGFEHAELQVVDGTAGAEWWSQPLSKLVDDFIERTDSTFGSEGIEWCDAVAADLEKQGQRLRDHAANLRHNTKDHSSR